MATKKERLAEIRRRLGPYTAQNGVRPNESELARRLVELIELVAELVDEICP